MAQLPEVAGLSEKLWIAETTIYNCIATVVENYLSSVDITWKQGWCDGAQVGSQCDQDTYWVLLCPGVAPGCDVNTRSTLQHSASAPRNAKIRATRLLELIVEIRTPK